MEAIVTEPKDVLQALVDHFWRDNASLQDMILRDVYARGYVSEETNEAMQARSISGWTRPRLRMGER